MELSTAIDLIRRGVDHSNPQVWADLGCGNGLFTRALAQLLPAGSNVYALDRDMKTLALLGELKAGVSLHKITSDFTKDLNAIPSCDGVLMANSLHFVADKQTFLTALKRKLKSSGKLIVVEYDTDQSNQWIPFAVSFSSIRDLSQKGMFSSCEKLWEIPSRYNTANLYSALIKCSGE
jgi:ubiquinone/menaquinone biosynthesis C-methylase UbiE